MPFGYDLAGRLATIVDANGVLSKQRFEGAGDQQLTMQWAGDGALSKTAYDVFGEQRKVTDAAGKVTEYTTDNLGNVLTATRLGVTRRENFTDANAVAASLTDTYVYDALGRRIKHTNALGWADKTYYDSLGRVVRSVSAGGRETTYTYAFVAAGTAVSSGGIIGAGGANLGGWQLTTQGADGRKTVDRTDYFGRTTWHQDQGGRTYVYSYDFAGRLSSQTSSAGQNIQYGYYANGFIKEARDLANRMMSRYGYDNAGNRIWEMYSGLDAGGTAPVGLYQDSKIQYDELGRMVLCPPQSEVCKRLMSLGHFGRC